VDSVEAVDRLEVNNPEKLAFLTQPRSAFTIPGNRRPPPPEFPKIVGPKSDDICYATQNRQDAVEQVARDVDLSSSSARRTAPIRIASSKSPSAMA